MKFNSNIYREIETYDVNEFLYNFDDAYVDGDNRLHIVEEINALNQFGKPIDKLTEKEYNERTFDNIIQIKAIKENSLIFNGLVYWYGSFDNILKGVRGAFFDYSEDILYYGTGVGYDTTSDLLCCDCDGTARTEFVNFLNEDEDVMKQGGYVYLKSKNKETCAYDEFKKLSKSIKPPK